MVVGNTLYVADTENHTIRRVDLTARTVETVAGTGEQYGLIRTPTSGPARTIALSSPWDLACNGDDLYIAMAGMHRIFVLHLDRDEIEPFAGAGPEAIRDGDYDTALFAQPNGLTLDDSSVLYVADSETSAVRAIELAGAKQVRTLVGTGLFDFGDVDGIGDNALLQHVQAVCFVDGLVYLTDTYNNRIKVLNPQTREVTSLAGNGMAGFRDGTFAEAQFNEPAGLAFANGKLFVTEHLSEARSDSFVGALNSKLYVADTNNNAIRVLHLTEGTVETLKIE